MMALGLTLTRALLRTFSTDQRLATEQYPSDTILDPNFMDTVMREATLGHYAMATCSTKGLFQHLTSLPLGQLCKSETITRK